MNEIIFSDAEARGRFDALLADLNKPLIALSGGADSSLIAARIAVVSQGGGAATLTGPLYAAVETERARMVAQLLKLPHHEIFVDALAHENIRNNPVDRCYHCRRVGMGRLIALAQEMGYGVVLDGENSDDGDDYRPGTRALRELGMRAPLREAGFTKLMIRRWSAELGLPTAHVPSAACLASRIPFGTFITDEALRRVEQAEAFLRNRGMTQVRVRHFDDTACIETDPENLPTLAARPNRDEVIAFFAKLGYRRVTLDLAGYRMGSLNPFARHTEK